MCCCLGIFLLRELSQAVRLLTGHQSHLSWEIPSLVPLRWSYLTRDYRGGGVRWLTCRSGRCRPEWRRLTGTWKKSTGDRLGDAIKGACCCYVTDNKDPICDQQTWHSRGWALDVVPAFGQVLFEVAEGAQTQLPPNVRSVLLLDQEDLPQSLDFLLHLCSITPVSQPDSTIFASLPRCYEPRHLR